MSELENIRILIAVIKHGSLTKAARSLNLSKSIISRRIAQMEVDLGTRLLNRITRGIIPTEAGLELQRRGESILAQIVEAREVITQGHAEVVGRLRLALPLAFGVRYITPLLAELSELHPRLHIDACYSDRHVDVVGGGFDLAVRLGSLKDSTLVSRRIAPIPIVVVASPAYVDRHGAPATPDDLAHHECLIYTGSRERVSWDFRSDQRRVSIAPNGRLFADNGEALVRLAEAGLGIIAAPIHLVTDGVSAGRLVTLLTEYPMKERGFYVVRPPGRYVPATVRAFIELLVRSFESPPWAEPPTFAPQRLRPALDGPA
jgi:DNA-binding transcriptional LysR family regulator